MKALFDTNILIDYLNQQPQAKTEFSLYDTRLICAITWMEVLVGIKKQHLSKVKNWLNHYFEIVEISEEIRELAVIKRKQKKIKLPDALIYASAQASNALLVTRNTKDFPDDDPMIRIPYSLTDR